MKSAESIDCCTNLHLSTFCLSLQKLLWVLSSLSDDDLVYKDDMREAGLPAVLVALFSVYQANQGAAELRPIAAQILRWVGVCVWRGGWMGGWWGRWALLA